MDKEKMLTQSRLKDLFSYCPELGIFTRLTKASQVDRGSIAGGDDGDGYSRFSVDGKSYQAHRLAWLYVYGKFPNNQVDHANHIRSDNRISNLRDVTHHDNGKNLSLKKNNSSGVTGVNWDSSRGKWYSCIMVDGKTKSLGRHSDKNDAIAARKDAEKLYGFHANHGLAV